MRRILNTLLLSGLSACVLGAGALMAQVPGGGQQSPSSSPQSTSPNGPGSPGVGPGSMPGNGPDVMPAKMDDKKFAKDAAMGGLTEVELGKLAAQKGSSDAVKQFGQKMVDDHSKANEELKQLASKDNLTIPDSLDSKHKSRVDKLAKLSGPEFDKAYSKDQLKDHQQDVNEFQREAQTGSDALVKQFALKTLPTLQEHLSMAKNLNKTEKETAANK